MPAYPINFKTVAFFGTGYLFHSPLNLQQYSAPKGGAVPDCGSHVDVCRETFK